MRIIAGSARGRKLRVPESGTRPTSDRVRESMFSTLDAKLTASGTGWSKQHVLDLFAGSGALGLEAMSRGAHDVVFVDKSATVSSVLRENCRTVGVDPRSCRTKSVRAWLTHDNAHDNAESSPFTMVFVDPPYAFPTDELIEILALLENLLAPNALVVVERASSDSCPLSPGLEFLDERTYGDTTLWYGRSTRLPTGAPSAMETP